MGEGSTKTKKHSFLKSIYRKIELYFESSALRSIEDFRDSRRKDYVSARYIHYRDVNVIVGTIGPVIVSIIPAVWTKPDVGLFWFNIVSQRCAYWIVVIGVLLFCIVWFTMTFLQKNVWGSILEGFKTEDSQKKDLEIQKLEKEKDELNIRLDVMKSDVERLQEFQSVTAYYESKRKSGKQQSISNVLVQRVLAVLGTGELSVALYHSYDSEFLLDEYESTRIKQESPSSLNKIIDKADKKYGEFFFNRCLFEKQRVMHCLFTREEVSKTLTGNIDDINQYACCNIEIEKSHNILLEIIAYNNTCFAYDGDCKDAMERYFDSLFEKYMPLIKMFIWNEDIVAKFQKKRA